jgi:hypothetical protein
VVFAGERFTANSEASSRKRYLEYLSTLEQVVRDAAKGTTEQPMRGLVLSRA